MSPNHGIDPKPLVFPIGIPILDDVYFVQTYIMIILVFMTHIYLFGLSLAVFAGVFQATNMQVEKPLDYAPNR